MLNATLVSSEDELSQIHLLNQQNLKQNLSLSEKQSEGFVSWLYPLALLQQMHSLAPSVIVKDGNKVAGYALATLKEAASFHADLQTMMNNLKQLTHDGKPIFSHNFYCMGQICIDKNYRGKEVFNMLYQKHKEVYNPSYDLLLTEISSSNRRSLKAHEKVGFTTIYTHLDAMDQWKVVVWNWK